MVYPMAALVLLTLYVAVLMFRARVKAIKARAVPFSYFKTYSTANTPLPEAMVLSQRCYNNLLEMPTLFYVACLAAMVLGISGNLMVILAWAYVGFRVAQAALHLAGNIIWRMRMFAGSCLCLLAMWGVLAGTQLAR
ncbi:MAG TPA: MAPEG family protein [Cellvibrionaceae bacterium]